MHQFLGGVLLRRGGLPPRRNVAQGLFLLPALERGEVLAELLAVLVGGEIQAGVLVELVEELHSISRALPTKPVAPFHQFVN